MIERGKETLLNRQSPQQLETRIIAEGDLDAAIILAKRPRWDEKRVTGLLSWLEERHGPEFSKTGIKEVRRGVAWGVSTVSDKITHGSGPTTREELWKKQYAGIERREQPLDLGPAHDRGEPIDILHGGRVVNELFKTDQDLEAAQRFFQQVSDGDLRGRKRE